MRDNILKDVYNNQLVELNSIEVKLANIKELDAFYSAGKKEFDKSQADLIKIKNLVNDVKVGYRQAGIQWTSALKVIDDISAQVKALGIEIPANLAGRGSSLKNNVKEALDKIVNLQNVEKLL